MNNSFEKYLNNLSNLLESDVVVGILASVLNELKFVFQERVHVLREDRKGNSLGGYSNPYIKSRIRQTYQGENRQIRYKDLELTGDLRRSYQVASSGNKVALFIDDGSTTYDFTQYGRGIKTITHRDKAGFNNAYNIKINGQDIYKLSDIEIEALTEEVSDLLTEKFEELNDAV